MAISFAWHSRIHSHCTTYIYGGRISVAIIIPVVYRYCCIILLWYIHVVHRVLGIGLCTLYSSAAAGRCYADCSSGIHASSLTPHPVSTIATACSQSSTPSFNTTTSHTSHHITPYHTPSHTCSCETAIPLQPTVCRCRCYCFSPPWTTPLLRYCYFS